jgi:hypothetical protein
VIVLLRDKHAPGLQPIRRSGTGRLLIASHAAAPAGRPAHWLDERRQDLIHDPGEQLIDPGERG